ncbi:MAG TPA: radical SAM family RiPP maturation amino acid epimerase [Streptosporangiaceae bacterium]
MPTQFYDLLGDLSDVPPDYIRDVSHLKRFLERWTMDPAFQVKFRDTPREALASIGVELTPADVTPLIVADEATAATRLILAGRADEVSLAVRRYRVFINEKVRHRRQLRAETVPGNPLMRAWRDRMIMRCVGELGPDRAEAIVHAPMAIELSKGCTVGCWFCGVAAPKFEQTWRHTPENAELWRECLAVIGDVIGPNAKNGFLYWATDPLDNPDYEDFLADFHQVLGRCPQTTTAQGQKDIERTRRLLRLAESMGSEVDRFSIIALNSLNRVHEGFSAEELLKVECVPQNKEAAEGGRHLKSNAGRARKFAHKRGNELVDEEQSSTIACVSGFLFNMLDRSVKLISPCNASQRWPLGYWVIAEGTFGTAEELRELMRAMVDEHMRDSLSVLDTVRLRRDVKLAVEDGQLRVLSMGYGLNFSGQPKPEELAALIAARTNTVEKIALYRKYSAGVEPERTLAVLDQLFVKGFIEEEPSAPSALSAPSAPKGAGEPIGLRLTGQPAGRA